ILCDVLIVRKIYIIWRYRTSSITAYLNSSESGIATGFNIGNTIKLTPVSSSSKPNKFETRIAFAFLWLSLSFLIPTIIFNSRSWLQDFFLFNLIS
ncbi:hypothetical protein PMAYCL1PPCAC_14623, partial [Pristionchus mayeri]